MQNKNERYDSKDDQITNASTITDATSWDRIRSELIPIEMFRELPDKEKESCDLLVDAIANSIICYPMEGDVVAKLGDNFELIFRVRRTLERRDRFERFGIGGVPDGQFLASGISYRRPIELDIRHSSPSFHDLAAPYTCVWAEDSGPHEGVFRDCVGFVQWAESGFPGFPMGSTSRVFHRIRLHLEVLEYSMLAHFREIVDQVRVQTFPMSWDAVFESYESAIAELDESEFESLVRCTLLGWILFPEKRPFPGTIDQMGSDEIVRALIEESTYEDRRYQNGRHDNNG